MKDWIQEQYMKERSKMNKNIGEQLSKTWKENKQAIVDGNENKGNRKIYSVGEWVWIVPLKKKGLVCNIDPKNLSVTVSYSYIENGKEKWAGNEYKFWEVDKTKQPHEKREQGLDHSFKQVRKFHRKMNQPVATQPAPLNKERALFRTILANEELVEFLYATVKGDFEQFDELVDRLIEAINNARNKSKNKGEKIEDILVSQMDASTDAKYILLGTDVEMGVYPQEIFDIVQTANLAKLFPDGKPHFNEHGKVIKPDNWERDYAPEGKILTAIQGQIKRAMAKQRK